MVLLADASSLIVLARLDGLILLSRAVGDVELTRDVEAEVVTAGKAKGYADASRVEEAIARGTLVVLDPTATERRLAVALGRRASGLSEADCIGIVCARERGRTLLIDDLRARRVAMAESVACHALVTLPLTGYLSKRLDLGLATRWQALLAEAMRSDPVVVEALATAVAQVAQRRGEMQERTT